MIGYYEHETDQDYQLAIFSVDDGYLMQFVRGVNLEVQTFYTSFEDVYKVAQENGFDVPYRATYTSGILEELPRCYKTRLLYVRDGEIVNENPTSIFYLCKYDSGLFIEQWSDNLFYARTPLLENKDFYTAIKNWCPLINM